MIWLFCKIPSSVRPGPNVMVLSRYLSRVYVYNQNANDFLLKCRLCAFIDPARSIDV